MSRFWTAALGVTGAITVSGCAELGMTTRGVPVETQVAVSEGSVVVAGPRGFCVDPTSTRADNALPFVMMGNCAAISGDVRAPQPEVKAVLTATVADLDPSVAFDSADPGLPGFFEAPEGRAALSRAGDPDTVEVLDSFSRGDVFYLHARDTSPGPVENLDPTHWRAVFGVNGRVVSASVQDFEGNALSPESSLAVLSEFTDRIRSQSVGRGTRQQAPAIAVADAPSPVAADVDDVVTVSASPEDRAAFSATTQETDAPRLTEPEVLPAVAPERPALPGFLRRIFG